MDCHISQNEFDAIMSASHKSTHQGGGGTESMAERKQWWADRKTLDNRLQVRSSSSAIF
jgi:hypothetical protein